MMIMWKMKIMESLVNIFNHANLCHMMIYTGYSSVMCVSLYSKTHPLFMYVYIYNIIIIIIIYTSTLMEHVHTVVHTSIQASIIPIIIRPFLIQSCFHALACNKNRCPII